MLLAAVVLGGATVSPLHAFDPAVMTMLGGAIHAYHRGDYESCRRQMDAVIAAGGIDPRAYYFRGLALMQLGRDDEARADMAEGARLEATTTAIALTSRSLQRVQGSERLLLERYRSEARVATLERNREQIRNRYVGQQQLGSETLRERRPEGTPREQLPSPSTPTPSPGGGDDAVPDDLFGETADEPAMPADPGDPFADEPAAGGNRQPPATMPEPEPEPEPPAAPENEGHDLFGGDPFGVASAPGSDSVGDQRDGRDEVNAAAVTDDTIDQVEGQAEMRAAEADDVFDQRDGQAERDAAAGDGSGPLVEEIFD